MRNPPLIRCFCIPQFIAWLLITWFGLPTWAEDWPSAYHDPANTCISSEAIHLPLTRAWHADNIHGPMVTARGSLFVPSSTGCFALRLTDGTRKWKVPGNFNNAYFSDGVLYVSKTVPQDPRSHLLAIEADTGAVRWDVRWEGDGYPLSQHIDAITGYTQHLFITNSRAQLVEVDPANGTPIRTAQFPGWGQGTPAFAGEYAYWGGSNMLTTLFLTDWTTKNWGVWDGGNSYPIVWGQYLVIQGPIKSTQIYRLQDGRPRLLYRFYGAKGHGHGVAPVGDGLVLSRSDNPAGYLAARDIGSGKVVWQAPMDDPGMCSATRDYVFVCGRNRVRDARTHIQPDQWRSALFVIRSRDGRIVGRYPSSSYGIPIIADGKLIVSTGQGIDCYTGR